MLSDEQIKEGAKKRLESMDPEVRKQYENDINAMLDLRERKNENGSSLSKKELNKFHQLVSIDLTRASGGEFDNKAMEEEVMRKLNISKEELATMKKNPYKAGMYKQILLTVLANLGIVATYGASKAFGIDGTIAYPVLSGLSGFFALGFGNQLINSIKFRNLQKKLDDPKYQNAEIDAEAYRMIRDEVKKGRGI